MHTSISTRAATITMRIIFILALIFYIINSCKATGTGAYCPSWCTFEYKRYFVYTGCSSSRLCSIYCKINIGTQPVCCGGSDYRSKCHADCDCAVPCQPERCADNSQQVTASELNREDDVLEFVGLNNGKQSLVVNVMLVGVVTLLFVCCITICYCRKRKKKYECVERNMFESEEPGYDTENGVDVDEENLMLDK